MATERSLYSTISIVRNGYFYHHPPPQKKELHDSLTPLSFPPGLHILTQKAVILDTWRKVRKVLAE